MPDNRRLFVEVRYCGNRSEANNQILTMGYSGQSINAQSLLNRIDPLCLSFEPNDQGSTSASSIRLPNGSAKKASLRLMAGKTNGSVTITTPRARSLATVSSTLVTLRQK